MPTDQVTQQSKSGRVKVRVSFTVDIDAEAWATEYGVSGATAIREDVRTYVNHTVLSHLDSLGLLA